MISHIKSIGFKASFAYCFLLLGPLASKGQNIVNTGQKDEKKEINAAESNYLARENNLYHTLSLSKSVSENCQFITSLPEKLVIDQFKCMETTIAMPYNSKVKNFINYYTAKDRRYIRLMLERKHMFFPIYEEALNRHGLPDELKYLSMVESSLNPRAMSPVKAAGLWQFMSVTGRYYDLRQDAYIDERLDPYKATDAACRYLKELHNMFGDWHMALAAYNCGPGNVRKAIRHSGNKKTFWQIYNFLPAETRAYVPKFIALNYVMNYAEAYNITTSTPLQPMPADTILVNQYLNMSLFAKQLGISAEDLQQLNPQYKRNFIPAYGGFYSLRIPAGTKEFLDLNRYAILNSSISSHRKILYQVNSGEGIATISRKFEVSVEDVKRWNRLKSNTINANQKLVIWVNQTVQPRLLTKTQIQVSNRIQPVVTVKPLPVPQIKLAELKPSDNLWRDTHTLQYERDNHLTKLFRYKNSTFQLVKN